LDTAGTNKTASVAKIAITIKNSIIVNPRGNALNLEGLAAKEDEIVITPPFCGKNPKKTRERFDLSQKIIQNKACLIQNRNVA
jgi:hypothetical protein